VSGASVDTTVVTTEEMELYSKHRKRIAIILTEKKSYGELDKLNYTLVSNYSKPKVLAVSTRNKPYLDVCSFLLQKFKSGMIVIEKDTISDPITDLVCHSDGMFLNDIDIMICREGLECITPNEIQKANLLRIHANPELNPLIFNSLQEIYQEKTATIMIAQYFANDQYNEASSYLDSGNERYEKQGMKDYLDIYEISKQLSFFVYLDIIHNKILNVSKESIIAFLKKLKASGAFPIPDEQMAGFAEDITIPQ
jgi:hypothetical protein